MSPVWQYMYFLGVELLDVGIALCFPQPPISRNTFAIESACRRCGKSRWILLCLTIKNQFHTTKRCIFLLCKAQCTGSLLGRTERAKLSYMKKRSTILNVTRSNFLWNYEPKITEARRWIVFACTQRHIHLRTHTHRSTHARLRERQ